MKSLNYNLSIIRFKYFSRFQLLNLFVQIHNFYWNFNLLNWLILNQKVRYTFVVFSNAFQISCLLSIQCQRVACFNDFANNLDLF